MELTDQCLLIPIRQESCVAVSTGSVIHRLTRQRGLPASPVSEMKV